MKIIGSLLGISMLTALGIAVAGTAKPPPPELYVTSQALAYIPDGKRLLIDYGRGVEASFNFSRGPIDWSRIELADRNGRKVAMNQLLATRGAGVLLSTYDSAFRLSTPPSGLAPATWYCFEYLNDAGEVEWLCVDL